MVSNKSASPGKSAHKRAMSPDISVLSMLSTVHNRPGVCEIEPLSTKGKRLQLFKMILMTLLPIMCIWGFTVYSLTDTVYSNQATKQAVDQMGLIIELGELVHKLETERDMSILYLSVLGSATKTFLVKDYAKTDDAIASLRSWPKRINKSEFSSKSALFNYIAYHRNAFDPKVNDIETEIDFYSSIIRVFLGWMIDNIQKSGFGSNWKSLVAYQKLTRGKEAIGIERAYGAMFYIEGGFTTWSQFETYNNKVHVFRYSYESAVYYSDLVEPINTYHLSSQGRNVTEAVLKFRSEIQSYVPSIEYTSINKAQWLFQNMTLYLDNLLTIQAHVALRIMEKISEISKLERISIGVYASLLIIVILTCPVIMYSVETLTSNIQRYALTLIDKTEELTREKVKTDSLLYQMVPRPVAESLKKSNQCDAQYFKSTTIMFSDVFGFTKMTTELRPMELVEVLNNLYTAFDEHIEEYDVYKVETINDCYMVASGVPIKNSGRHVTEIADLSLDLMTMVRTRAITFSTSRNISIRIGFNSGSCMAGIVGSKMIRYCLFGDTVNVASRMKSYGLPNKIQISQSSHDLLIKNGGFRMKYRGNIDVKGKGTMKTYWLQDKNVQVQSDSDQEEELPGEITQGSLFGRHRNMISLADSGCGSMYCGTDRCSSTIPNTTGDIDFIGQLF